MSERERFVRKKAFAYAHATRYLGSGCVQKVTLPRGRRGRGAACVRTLCTVCSKYGKNVVDATVL